LEKTLNTSSPIYNTRMEPFGDEISRQLVFGSLFGDGAISKTDLFYREHHSIKQSDYLKWKNSILRFSFYEYPDDKHPTCQIRSRKLPLLETLYKKYYSDDKKKVAEENLNDLTELGLLVWYLDKGSYNYYNHTVYISTNISRWEQETIVAWFMNKWNIEPTIHGKRICFPQKQTDSLLRLIYPVFREYHLPQCMLYKMGHFTPENSSRAERAQSARKSGRQISVYIRRNIAMDIAVTCAKTPDREIAGLLFGTFPRREITSFTVLPFPSDRKGIYYDKKALAGLSDNDKNKICVGWFHSHVEDSDVPSDTDCRFHTAVFPLDKYVMMIVNVTETTFRTYDHIKPDGAYRVCQPVLNDQYTRMALPDNETLSKHIKDRMSVQEIATTYGVSQSAVYGLLRRLGIPTHFEPPKRLDYPGPRTFLGLRGLQTKRENRLRRGTK